MILRWFISSQVRDAVAMRKHVRRILSAQRDLLTPAASAAVTGAIHALNDALKEKHTGKIRIKMEELEFAANKWLKSYPHSAWRENIEVLLVALAVAMAIRTFFVQPFKIPTGSMQPTLFGVMSDNLRDKPDFKIPTGWARVREWFAGISYVHVVAQTDGEIQKISPISHFLIFNLKQSLWINGVEHVMWFPPDYGEQPFESRAQLERGHVYHKGDDVVKMQVSAGDHVFVDRGSYNFRKPTRGEIIVFET